MLIDYEEEPHALDREFDVCVVGGGAAGITLAHELAGSGLEIALLESGGLEFDGQTQALYQGESIGAEYFPLEISRLRYFGGSTNHWEGWCRELDREDFTAGSWLSMSGWPLDKDELRGEYDRAHELCELGAAVYDIPDLAAGDGHREIRHDDTGLESSIYRHSPPTRFGERYRAAFTSAEDVVVALHANLVEVQASRHRVEGVRIAGLSGTTGLVRASRYVLALGGLENPRLMLASSQGGVGAVGNAHDLVGRCFMEHLHVPGGYLLTSERELRELALYTDGLETSEARVRGFITLAPEVRRHEGLLNWSATLHRSSEASDELRSPFLDGVQSLSALSGAGHPDEAVAVSVRSEQEPNPASRVRLARTRDALGMRRVLLDWRLSALDYRSIQKNMERAAAGLAALDLGRVYSFAHDTRRGWRRIVGGSHHMGTTRMADDPRDGVVDRDCRVHGMENLYIAGSSVFPTGGYGNPTLTLVALAVRLAGHLSSRGRA